MKSSIKTCLVKLERMISLTKFTICIVVILSIVFTANVSASLILDADTPAGGGNLLNEPLVTPYGTITFEGEFKNFAVVWIRRSVL